MTNNFLTTSMIGREVVRLIGQHLRAAGIVVKPPVQLDSPLIELAHEYSFQVAGLDMNMDDLAEGVLTPAVAAFVARLNRNGALAIGFVSAGRGSEQVFDSVIACVTMFGNYAVNVSVTFVVEKRKFLD